ncbi:hypothetical protein MMC19_002694 [Ptychographa xylographoides]|nr:hypothetical protein [Ptychographa xylographoides]
MTLYLTFLRRTSAGLATFKVRDVKLGRQTSTIHIALTQGSDSREEVVGYVTHTNISSESGLTLPTNWSLLPLPKSIDFSAVEENKDKNWKCQPRNERSFATFRKASQKVDFYLPTAGQLDNSIIDEWLRLTTGEKFTMDSLGFVADMFPQVVESYRRHHPQHSAAQQKKWGTFWYPTLLLNLEIKKVLPPEGVEWLFVRVRTKVIRNGRMDLEVVVLDQGGDVVALSQHVSLIVGAERNLAGREVNEGGSPKL